MDDKAVDVVVTGHVQGVFFRVRMSDRAQQLGVRGWARNAEDGSVQAHLEGPGEAVDTLVAWCEQGPPAARVANVTVAAALSAAAPSGGAPGFEIRP